MGGLWENWVSESCQMVYKTWPNIVLPLSKCMGFAHKGLWGMAYHRFMGYGMQFPANQVGGSIRLWDITGYGLCQVWVKAGSTVRANFGNFRCDMGAVHVTDVPLSRI